MLEALAGGGLLLVLGAAGLWGTQPWWRRVIILGLVVGGLFGVVEMQHRLLSRPLPVIMAPSEIKIIKMISDGQQTWIWGDVGAEEPRYYVMPFSEEDQKRAQAAKPGEEIVAGIVEGQRMIYARPQAPLPEKSGGYR